MHSPPAPLPTYTRSPITNLTPSPLAQRQTIQEFVYTGVCLFVYVLFVCMFVRDVMCVCVCVHRFTYANV